ncbi:virulence-associated E family protein [Vibrio tapetis]|nr:virulence-associated E family protein [Vibrio tapetis]
MKTAFIERIAKVVPEAFLEGAELNPDNKDSVLSCIRSWIVELGELERSTKNSQGGLKAFITREVDTVRPPYARADIKKPRQTHFIATVNGTDFLKDETGNSRYAVIELSDAVDMDKLNKLLGWHFNGTGGIRQVDAEQLKQFWLELKHLYLGGFAWMLTKREQQLSKLAADKHVDKGCWYVAIFEHVTAYQGSEARTGEWQTSTQVCQYLGLPTRNVRQVGKALTLLAKEGHIEVKLLRGTQRYLIPTINHSN